MARNKRLHVEMALIKLNFLQQAIELATENGNLVKKKRLDTPVAYKVKPINPLQIKKPEAKKTEAESSKLFIAPPIVHETAAIEEKEVATGPVNTSPVNISDVATKTIAKPVAKKNTSKTNGNKKSLLDGLRQKYGEQYLIEEIKEAEALSVQRLREIWKQYLQRLKEQQKHSSVSTFKLAKLKIEAENFFTVTVNAITQQKFIEQEKTLLLDHIQTSFNNRSISFKILIEEGEQEKLPAHLTMNSREKFERIAEQYPLVKELKDKLKLELDY
jgi:DNA polymerase-3 subunit gamma/tau